MSTRVVTFSVLKPDGTPMRGHLRFRLVPGSYEPTVLYPTHVITSAIDSDGSGTVNLWANEGGEEDCLYICTLPSRETFQFTVPTSAGPFDLSDLRASGPSNLFPNGGTQLVNVLDPRFGVTGDGVTDDTAEIAAAQAYLDARGGGVLFFPPGTYGYSASIVPTESVTWRGAGIGVSVLKCLSGGGAVIDAIDINNVVVEHLCFDHNGGSTSFHGAVRAEDCRRVNIRNNLFTDNNPETAAYALGTGDGVTVTFAHEFTTSNDRMVMPGTVVITAGAITATADWNGLWSDPDNGPARIGSDDVTGGLVEYGDNNGNWRMSATFAVAPAVGVAVALAWGRCDQRQPILLLRCSEFVVEGNYIERGGRIKVGRPGNRGIIRDNILYGVNDNGITAVMSTGEVGSTERTSDIRIQGNIIYYAATTGIFLGMEEGDATYENYNAQVLDNVIVGNCMNGITYQAPAGGGRRVAIARNIVQRIGTWSTIGDRNGISVRSEAGIDYDYSTEIIVSDNIVDGAFTGSGLLMLRGRRISCKGNILRGRGATDDLGNGCTGIDIAGALSESDISHNIFTNVDRVVEVTGSLVNVNFDHNIIQSVFDAANDGIFYLDGLTAVTRFKVRFNTIVGAAAPVGTQYVIVADVTTNMDIELRGNDWSATASISGFRFTNGATLASTFVCIGNRGASVYGTDDIEPVARKYRHGTITSAFDAWGTGSPESVVTGPVGSVWHRTDGGAATSIYIKESGTGNTGWVAK